MWVFPHGRELTRSFLEGMLECEDRPRDMKAPVAWGTDPSLGHPVNGYCPGRDQLDNSSVVMAETWLQKSNDDVSARVMVGKSCYDRR